MLTNKTVMLLAFLTGQRRQTLQALDVLTMVIDGTKCTFFINLLLKTSCHGKHLGPIELLSYKPNMRLCPVTHIHEYLEQTAKFRREQRKLFIISYQMPHKEVLGGYC